MQKLQPRRHHPKQRRGENREVCLRHFPINKRNGGEAVFLNSQRGPKQRRDDQTGNLPYELAGKKMGK